MNVIGNNRTINDERLLFPSDSTIRTEIPIHWYAKRTRVVALEPSGPCSATLNTNNRLSVSSVEGYSVPYHVNQAYRFDK